MPISNKVQLITYPDSLGGDLPSLEIVLDTHFSADIFGGIHILPPFPSSGDRGFAPLTYLEIEKEFGSWEDIRRLGAKFDLMLDLMVNHISAKSEYFQDFLAHGKQSRYADMFLPIEKIWPEGEPTRAEIEKIFLRRDTPYSLFTIANSGETVKVWTTFGKTDPSEQIDLDINSEVTRKILTEFMKNFSKNNVNIVRLDAVGYVIKKPGTSFFFVEPEVYKFMEWITKVAEPLGIELLPEVHAHYETQYKLADEGYWIYDFILPYMVLDCIFFHRNTNLLDYLKTRPERQITTLDCHDGVPVKPDLNDLYDSEDARKLVDICLERGGNLSLIYSPKHRDADGFDVHQIRGTYYSLIGCNDDAYLAARAIQFFTPGIPQVYYVGLLAGKNDNDTLAKKMDGRSINRYNYTCEEIEWEVQKDVVQRLLRLIRFRNTYEAFNGKFEIVDSDPQQVILSWKNGAHQCTLKIDLETYATSIVYKDEANGDKIYSV